MIAHTLLYRFPPTAPEHLKEEFFAQMRELLHGTGLICGFDHQPHLRLPADDRARAPHSEVVAQFTCANLEDLATFSELPAVHAFLAPWRERLGFEVAYINHAKLHLVPPQPEGLEHAEHASTVAAPVEVVWDVLVDVTSYPDIFPPTREVTVLEERPGYQLARFLVDVAPGQTLEWVSRRLINHACRTISYEQVDKAPVVAHMSGEWRAFPLSPEHTQLVLTHDYAARVPEGNTMTIHHARQLLVAAIERNSVADLTAVRAEAERRTTIPAALRWHALSI